MNEVVNGLVPSALSRPYRYVKLEWNADFAMVTVRMAVRPIQCYSLAAMAELQQVFNDITAHPGLVRHFVMASDVQGVFNFGGDLSLFVLLVRAHDLDSLRLYARRCIDLVWWWENAASLGVHTTALVQGDALGGGTRIGSPASHGDLRARRPSWIPGGPLQSVPGNGGWNLAIRRGGFNVANDLVLSGQIYTADQLFRRGLVDIVVEDGDAPQALERMVHAMEPRFRGTMAALQARRVAAPISHEMLLTIVDHWAVTAMSLNTRDMRLMERLARAQVRKVGGANEGAVEEIKRMELDTAWGFERTGVSEWATLE